MEYIRVKVSDGKIPQSQIMSESELTQWFKGNNIWNRVMKDGMTISFSPVKKSTLLKKQK